MRKRTYSDYRRIYRPQVIERMEGEMLGTFSKREKFLAESEHRQPRGGLIYLISTSEEIN